MSDKIDLNSPEVKEAIQAAVDAAIAPLAAKRDELLAENRKLKAGKQVSPEDYASLEAERDELRTKLDQSGKDLKATNTKLEQVTKALETESGFTKKLLADNGLSEALVAAGVKNPAHLKAVKALLSGQVQIVTEGDQRIAKVGDKALSDFVTEWAASDDGKHFVSASNNTGGGSQGGSGGGNEKTMTRAQFDAADHATRAKFAKEGGKVID